MALVELHPEIVVESSNSLAVSPSKVSMNPWSFVNGASILIPEENREFFPVLQINVKYSTLNPKIKHQYLENVRSYSSIPCCFVSTIAFVRLAINLDSVLCVKVLFPLARISHLPKFSLQVAAPRTQAITP